MMAYFSGPQLLWRNMLTSVVTHTHTQTHTRAKNLPTRLLLQVTLVLPLVLVPISRLSMPNRRRRLAAREIQPQTERYT